MIKITQGNIVEVDAQALVNTVNCDGYMGKGIALQFKKAFPENFRAYKKACRAEEVKPGKMFAFETGSIINPIYIINFPTKRHWRGNSRITDIKSGLLALVELVKKLKVQSIAIPPLGCGLGGLNWRVVRPIIEQAMATLPDVNVLLFEPRGAPDAKTMPVGTKRPHLTIARALFISLMHQYEEMDYRLTLLEIQKLAYFLQEAGEPLQLNYEKGHFGPYAPNLNKVLEILEGHFIRGYGDTQKPDVDVELMDGALEDADQFLEVHNQSRARLERVADIIEGFETPYGMELLSSVHWVATHTDDPAHTSDGAIQRVHSWNDHKRRMLRPDHIQIAWDRLVEKNWLPEAK